MQQIAIETELATLLRDVDIIVAGGSNTILADSNDRLRAGDSAADTYPLSFDSAAGDPVLVVNTDGAFADDGTKQGALAEYLQANFPADDNPATPAVIIQDVEASADSAIQNLAVVATLLQGGIHF